MFLKFQKLNYLLLFLVILISFIGAAGLYSAAGGSYSPWASRHLIRLSVLFCLTILIAIIDVKIIYKYAYIIFIFSFLLLLVSETSLRYATKSDLTLLVYLFIPWIFFFIAYAYFLKKVRNV